MKTVFSTVFAIALGGMALLAAPRDADAQYLDPRLGQAMAVCNSPAGRLLTECQQLKAAAALGAVPGVAAAPGGAALGGLLGVAAGVAKGEQGPPGTTAVYNACLARTANNAALRAQCDTQRNAAIAGYTPPGGRAPAGAITPSPNASQAVQQQYVDCVQRAGVNQQALMSCGMALQGGVNLPQFAAGAPGPYDANTNTAMTIAGNGQAYRDCVSRLGGQPMGMNACTALLNAPAGSLPGSLPQGANTAYNPPAQGFNPPAQGYNPPAPGFPGAQAPNAPQAGKPFDPLAF